MDSSMANKIFGGNANRVANQSIRSQLGEMGATGIENSHLDAGGVDELMRDAEGRANRHAQSRGK